MIYKNARKNSYKKKEKEILNDFQAQKFYLMLYFNDYAFEWQLTKQLNLTKKQIQTYSEELNKQGLISFRLLSELSENMQEAIMKLTPDFSKIYQQNPKVYIITPEGKTQGKEKLSEFVKQAKDNQGIYDLIKQLKVYSESFRITKNKILKEEKSLIDRKVKFPDGTIIERPTQAYKNLLIELKINEKQNALVLKDINRDLIALEVDNELKTKRDEYTGLYSYLTAIEIEKLNEEANEKDLKLTKEEEKHLKEKILNLEKESHKEVLLMQGAKINKQEADRLNQEAEDFLNRLGGNNV